MLDYRLYTFLVLSKTLNFTKAASILCITQPAVSQHIKYLEATYHLKLFHQEGKQLILTPQGEYLHQCIERLAFDEKQMLKHLENFQHQQKSFCFGATLTIGEFALPNLLQQYITEHPHDQIKMIVENTSTLLDMLHNGDIQFAFVEGYFKKSEVTSHPFMKQRFVAVKNKAYTLKNEVHCLEDLLEETIILREEGSGTREIFTRALQEKNLAISDFHNYLEIGNMNVIKQFVANQQGITFLYETAVQKELRNGTFEILPLEDLFIEREFYFITAKETIFLEQYEDFFKALQQLQKLT